MVSYFYELYIYTKAVLWEAALYSSTAIEDLQALPATRALEQQFLYKLNALSKVPIYLQDTSERC